MPESGIRNLKIHASRILRNVRDRRARYIISYRGRPVAILAPLETAGEAQAAPSSEAVWEELLQLGAEIGKRWRSPLTSVELLSKERR